jgi:putative transposase
LPGGVKHSGPNAERKLALSIGEVGWYRFNTMLQYKAQWYGKNILYIGRFTPSSKLCSKCGTVFKELKLKDRSRTCPSCGTQHDRDENAEKNIKLFGLRNQPSTVNVNQKALAYGLRSPLIAFA